MNQFGTVAVGTLPLGIADDVVNTARPHETVARFELVTPEELIAQPPPFVAEWRRLSNGMCDSSSVQDAKSVRKVQLIGPITLLGGKYAPLQETFRGTRAALDTLLDHFPNVSEVWLDEPLLDRSHVEQLPLLEKCLRALRAEFFDLTFGVHVCGNAPWQELLPLEVIDVLHFDAWTYGDELLRALELDRSKTLEVVLGIVPTNGELPELDELVERVTHLRSQMPSSISLTRLSTSCGLAGLDPDDATRRLRRLDELASTLNRS